MKKAAILLVLALLLFSIPAYSQPRQDSFYVTIGAGTVLSGGGTGFAGGEWYVYPSLWINEWFYDHPFDPTKGKIIHVEFDWVAYDPVCPTNMTVAINWSTPEWSELGYGDAQPPLPGVDEAAYIVRSQILYMCGNYAQVQHFAHDFIIWPYNPEWVSIDVRGCNFIISNGMMMHDCTIGTKESSWGSIKESFK
jgi:hypothetical protein